MKLSFYKTFWAYFLFFFILIEAISFFAFNNRFKEDIWNKGFPLNSIKELYTAFYYVELNNCLPYALLLSCIFMSRKLANNSVDFNYKTFLKLGSLAVLGLSIYLTSNALWKYPSAQLSRYRTLYSMQDTAPLETLNMAEDELFIDNPKVQSFKALEISKRPIKQRISANISACRAILAILSPSEAIQIYEELQLDQFGFSKPLDRGIDNLIGENELRSQLNQLRQAHQRVISTTTILEKLEQEQYNRLTPSLFLFFFLVIGASFGSWLKNKRISLTIGLSLGLCISFYYFHNWISQTTIGGIQGPIIEVVSLLFLAIGSYWLSNKKVSLTEKKVGDYSHHLIEND